MEHSVIWHISTNVQAPFKSGQIQPLADWSHLNMASIFAFDCAAKCMQSTNVNTHKVRLFCSFRVEGISGLLFFDGNWERGWVFILQFYAQDCSHERALQSCPLLSCTWNSGFHILYRSMVPLHPHKFCHICYIFFLTWMNFYAIKLIFSLQWY